MNDAAPYGLDAFGTFDALRDSYLRYYDTAYRLRDERLQSERRQLLSRPGGVCTEPYLELRPEYATTGRSLAQSAALAGAPPELADFAALGLLPPDAQLYTHQEEALKHAVEPGRNVVVTAGTGAGKTEAFLLPILADLLAESRTWSGTPATPHAWWRKSSAPYASQRASERGARPQAVRALVLYPMNALVDDQLVRLRRALDSDVVRAWLDRHRAGHRFYFGRYTSATPVTGRSDQSGAVDELRDYLKATEDRSRRAQARGEDTQYFAPRLGGAEMVSRWDMYDAPPDILITNHSMLNIMLLRDRDRDFFQRTRAWLDSEPEARFTLVVDELHMHRGTPGTEVAYLVRNLRNRLGLRDRPEKIRVLAASASLDGGDRDRRFLEGFFALARDTFTFIGGSAAPTTADTTIDISGAAARLAAAEPVDATDARQLLTETGAASALRTALRGDADGPASAALPMSEVAERMFPGAGTDAEAALRTTLVAVRLAGSGGDSTVPRTRVHLFFRNVAGMWACADPRCPQIPGGTYPGRTVGQLYPVPRTRCECGARVLELLYCQSCGDALLGGYASRTEFGRRRFDSYLLPDTPDLEGLPEQSRRDRTASNYIVYWPSADDQQADDDGRWERDGGALTFAFRRSALDPRTGRLANGEQGATGWSFHVGTTRDSGGRLKRDTSALPPFPTRCPSCSSDWERSYDRKGNRLPAGDPGRFQSPVRTMRTGFEKVNQILAAELAGQFDEQRSRKLIVFTDSRQDAAKLSAGLALRHYQDLVRLVALDELHQTAVSPEDVAAAREFLGGRRDDQSRAAAERLRAKDGQTYDYLRLAWLDGDEGAALAAAEALTAPPTLVSLAKTLVWRRLLRLGVNPAGTAHSAQSYHGTPWDQAYTWPEHGGQPRPARGLSDALQEAVFQAEDVLFANTVEALFSGTGRDLESLGLGRVAPLDAARATKVEGLGEASLRILAELRRFPRMCDSRPKPPRRLREFWANVARNLGFDPDDMQDQADAYLRGIASEYVVDPGKVAVLTSAGQAWPCAACGRQHLTPSAGTCTNCGAALPAKPREPAPLEYDYYAWKAATRRGAFRLHCAELTGQTGRIEGQGRQARFQGVFLDDEQEHALVHELDLLSVTTTMEAGVDIGPLAVVVMANMPPTRFNYQQRVGRAGRRGSPVAAAVTVCRGRSHDEHYFRYPGKITNDPAPPPYLVLERTEILRRAAAGALLQQAFSALPDRVGSASVHGEFGTVEDWPSARSHVEQWLGDNPRAVAETAAALTAYTGLGADSTGVDCEWLDGLLSRISDEAARSTGSRDLGERLAHAGVLPMFGFPTRVRRLYLERPLRSTPWPPGQGVDRDIALAISQFAPGSETVRDGQVYTVTGVTEFEPQRRSSPQPIPEALAHSRALGLCPNCNHTAEAPRDATAGNAGPCPLCGSAAYRVVDLREPAGFRAGEPRDFDGTFAWSPRTVSARATADLSNLPQTSWRAAAVYAGPGTRYIVNDNNGDQFEFRRALGPWGGYVAVGARENDTDGRAVGDPLHVALGAALPTDFLFLGPQAAVDQARGYRLNLEVGPPLYGGDVSYGRRAAWYSLAFLLRSAAAGFLDVHPQELQAGIHPAPRNGRTAVYAFLADALENGAGFSSHLGSAGVFPEFAGLIQRRLGELSEPNHAALCTSSCYDCLRDYANMAYHPLLDWRLASELFGVLEGGELPATGRREDAALGSLQSLLDGERLDAQSPAFTCKIKGRRAAVVVKHPLEACEQELVSPRLHAALDAAHAYTGDATRVIVTDWLTLDKSPLAVIERLTQRR